MTTLLLLTIAPQVLAHGYAKGLWATHDTARSTTIRTPAKYRIDALTAPQSNRCNQAVGVIDGYRDPAGRIEKWCEDSEIWNPELGSANEPITHAMKYSDIDDGFCMGSAGTGTHAQNLLGKDIRTQDPVISEDMQTFFIGEDLTMDLAITAWHGGEHFIDMVAEDESQFEGLPDCVKATPGGEFAGTWSDNQHLHDNYVVPCIARGVNRNDAARQANSTVATDVIRLTKPLRLLEPINGTVTFTFKLPEQANIYHLGTPTNLRWVWFGGMDVVTGEYWDNFGNAELWYNCFVAKIGVPQSAEANLII